MSKRKKKKKLKQKFKRTSKRFILTILLITLIIAGVKFGEYYMTFKEELVPVDEEKEYYK